MPHPGKVPLMIVEDDANIRYLMQVAALRSGYFDPITLAADGREALEIIRASDATQLPGLIVSDLCMPHMTGLELLRTLKRDAQLHVIPVAIITSSDAPDDRDLALAAGACSFVPKPYGVEALISAFVALRETCGDAPAISRARDQLDCA
jgi:CheY-like chemotaxis protein